MFIVSIFYNGMCFMQCTLKKEEYPAMFTFISKQILKKKIIKAKQNKKKTAWFDCTIYLFLPFINTSANRQLYDETDDENNN